MVSLTAAQERVYRAGIEVARTRAEAERITFMFLTESNGRNLANDGAAFADDYATKRPGWAEGLETKQRREIHALLRTSLDHPNDGVGNNGGSTGPGQQLSQQYVAARFPGKAWGYGSIADTMDVTKSASMFRDRLVVTDDPVYAGIRFSDPLVADVLRVQQPLVSERESDNYSPSQVAKAKAIVAQLSTDEPPEDDGILDMADQAALDKYKEEIAQAVESKLDGLDQNAGEARRITGVLAGVTSLAGNGEKSVEQQVFEHKLPQIKGDYNFHQYLIELNRKVDLILENQQKGGK